MPPFPMSINIYLPLHRHNVFHGKIDNSRLANVLGILPVPIHSETNTKRRLTMDSSIGAERPLTSSGCWPGQRSAHPQCTPEPAHRSPLPSWAASPMRDTSRGNIETMIALLRRMLPGWCVLLVGTWILCCGFRPVPGGCQ